MISSIVFINQKGQILIYRVFKDDVTRTQTQQFCSRIVATKENKESPIILLDGTSFLHISYKDIIILATTKSNINAAMAIQFLYQLLHILKAYFQKQLDQNLIKKHFVLIYEILDQIMDYGMPQIMNPEILKQIIKEGGFNPQIMSNSRKLKQLTNQATGVVSWRKQGIIYKRNQVYIDILQSVNVIMSQKGTILKADVTGSVIVNAKLTGMPECKLGMNDKVLMEKEAKRGIDLDSNDKGIIIDDLKCHQCVKLSKFSIQRAITFTPPDQSFKLMTYKITQNINLPFKLIPIIDQINPKKIQIRLKLKSIFQPSIIANLITIKIPCPKNTAQTEISTIVGKGKFQPDQQSILWRIKKLPGDYECSFNCSLFLGESISNQTWSKPPITMQFQIPMFTASGMRVRYFRCYQKSGYKPSKWIRYVTKSGQYQRRV